MYRCNKKLCVWNIGNTPFWLIIQVLTKMRFFMSILSKELIPKVIQKNAFKNPVEIVFFLKEAFKKCSLGNY